MVPAIWEALSTTPADNRLRIVTIMTDGLIGNDFEIISMINKLREKSRWFSFGTGETTADSNAEEEATPSVNDGKKMFRFF